MKLYATIKSEKGKAEGKGGQDYLDIEITNINKKVVAKINVKPLNGERIKIGFSHDSKLVDFSNEIKEEKCECIDPLCAKCLLLNCKDYNCKVHPEKKKKEFRELYKNR